MLTRGIAFPSYRLLSLFSFSLSIWEGILDVKKNMENMSEPPTVEVCVVQQSLYMGRRGREREEDMEN